MTESEVSVQLDGLKVQGNGLGDSQVQDDDFVDPWNVVSKAETGVDYDKLISEFFLRKDTFYLS